MLSKIVVIALLFFIVISLFMALKSLVRNDQGDKQKVVKFLAWRVGLSALLLVLLGLSFYMGWLEPHGLRS